MKSKTILAAVAAFLVSITASAAEGTFKTVEEILKGTPFQVVTPAQYKARVKTGKVVGFFYENSNATGEDGWRARSFKDSIQPGMAITFLAVPRDPKFPDTDYLGLEFFKSPTYQFYQNGNKVFAFSGGQADLTPADYAKDVEILRRNLQSLNGMK